MIRLHDHFFEGSLSFAWDVVKLATGFAAGLGVVATGFYGPITFVDTVFFTAGGLGTTSVLVFGAVSTVIFGDLSTATDTVLGSIFPATGRMGLPGLTVFDAAEALPSVPVYFPALIGGATPSIGIRSF